jgi:hypothetical protein
VNVFAGEFELWGDTTDNRCLHQNDRWGWKSWGDNLYEIWWDVTTREWKEGEGDANDFMRFTIAGCAVDFNFWSSEHDGPFDAHQIFLGANLTPLSSIAEYDDYFAGIDDPYQSQAGSDPTRDPNITVFTQYSDTLRSFNLSGLIDSTDSHTCNLAVNYGERYAGTFAYQGNGIQFSTECAFEENGPPHIQLTPDATFFVCTGDSFCVDIFASDIDPGDSITVEKIFGVGTFASVRDVAPISDEHCFFPDTSGSYMFIFKVTDDGGLFDTDTAIITIELNEPPVLTVPADFDSSLCDTTTLCFDVGVTDPDGQVVVWVNPPGYYNSADGAVCFPAYQEGISCFGIVATDICEASDSMEVCITVSIGDPPLLNAPDTMVVSQGQTVQYTFTASDPDEDTLKESVELTIDPDCGEYSVERLAGWGTSSGEWRVTFEATDCAVGYHRAVVEVQDSCGRAGVDTTLLDVQTRLNNAPVVTVPEIDSVYVDSTLEYTAEAYDPDDDALLDQVNIIVVPDCGNAAEIRLTGSGTSSGTWEITFQTAGCNLGGHQVIVEIEDTSGATGSGTTYVEIMPHTGIDEENAEKVTDFYLQQNYPNPFNQRTEISFQLPFECKVDLRIYNLRGQLVKTLADGRMNKGIHTLFWDGTDKGDKEVASGIYFYKLIASDFVRVRKMMLLK